ncbi:MAG: outer membrane beta-barrel protein [Bacteroidales bacterium]|nr:outer membrane beta-barrel protein [Candidatus Sodaliphilus aphodohippi]
MKKLVLSLIMLVLDATFALADDNGGDPRFAFGAAYYYATEYDQHGMGISLQARLSDKVRIQPEMVYCNENKDVTTMHLNLNAHYVVPVFDRCNIYPLAGINYSHWGYEGPNKNHVGVNLGCGLEYNLGKRWWLDGGMRYNLVKQETQIIYTVGIKYDL